MKIKDPNAVELGRKGGHARARALSKAQRVASAKHASAVAAEKRIKAREQKEREK